MNFREFLKESTDGFEEVNEGEELVLIINKNSKMYNKVGRVFHTFDDGSKNIKLQLSNGDVANFTAKPNEFKVITAKQYKNMKSYGLVESEEVSDKQKAYRAFFEKKLKKYGVDSPSELDDKTKKKFFDEISSDWE